MVISKANYSIVQAKKTAVSTQPELQKLINPHKNILEKILCGFIN